MMSADGPVPNLRFPEFRDAGPWEVKRLGEIGTILKGRGIAKSDVKPDGSLPCIRYGELYTIYGETISDVVSRTDAEVADLVLSKEGDVIIPASGETKEDIATASCVAKSGVALGSDLNVFRSSLSGSFLAYYIRGNLKPSISKVAQGDSVVHLYPAQLEKLQLAIPSLAEQQKIADCLSSLDDLIRAEGARLGALKDHKRALMQRLFPRPGETTPRLRFPEFRTAGPWEVKRLGGCLKFQAGFPFASKNFNTVGLGFRLIRNRDLRSNEQPIYFDGNYPEDYKVENGDLLVSMDGEFYPIFWRGGTALLNQRVGRVFIGSHGNESFYFYLLSILLKSLEAITPQTTVKHLSHTDIETLEAALPSLPEQQKIAECLTALDELIRAQGERIEALRSHKRGLMQQLFPQDFG
jgi:type I restriction enzyme S subunit